MKKLKNLFNLILKKFQRKPKNLPTKREKEADLRKLPQPLKDSDVKDLLCLPVIPQHILRKFLETHKFLAYSYMLQRITVGVEEDVDQVAICSMGNIISVMSKELFEANLEEMIEFFDTSIDMAGLKTQCIKVLDRHKVNIIIREANQLYHKTHKN